MPDTKKSDAQAPAQADELSDIDPVFHGVVARYGRPMFAFLMQAGMAQQAAEVLSAVVGKHRSKHGLHAVGVWSQSFNALANEFIALKEWDAGLLAQCDRDIQLAWSGKLTVPEKLVLDS